MSLLTSLQVHDVPRVKLNIGEKVTEEGAPGCKVYVMIKGIVEVSISKQVIATVLDPGSIFGEIATENQEAIEDVNVALGGGGGGSWGAW